MLSKCDPEAVEIADDDFTHAVEHVVWTFNHVDAIFELRVNLVNIVDVGVEINFTSSLRAGLAALIEHHLAVSKRKIAKLKPSGVPSS